MLEVLLSLPTVLSPSERGLWVCLLLGPGRLCQHNFKHNRLSILVRIMLE